jgi:ribonuclease HI
MNGFFRFLGKTFAYKAELFATIYGLQLAHNMGIQCIELQVDSMVASISIQNFPRKETMVSCLLLKAIQNLLNCRWEVRVKHVYRETNQVADALANLGCSLRYDRSHLIVLPSIIFVILLANSAGVCTPRLISM